MNIIPKCPPIGATITNIDLTSQPTPELIKSIELALEHYGVLIFPDQELNHVQQINFSRAIGELEVSNTVSTSVLEFPELAEVGNIGNRPVSFAPTTPDGELEWHTDHIQHRIPSKSTLLYAKEVPDHGGDTLFACMYEAYDAIDADIQRQYDKIIALHSPSGLRDYLIRQGEFDGDNVKMHDEEETISWPLVRRHPLTGRKALYFAACVTIGIEGWEKDEALTFIKRLTQHSTQSRFIYRHKWKIGQVVLWDNRRVLHSGTWYDKQRYRRYLLRTMIKENLGVTGTT